MDIKKSKLPALLIGVNLILAAALVFSYVSFQNAKKSYQKTEDDYKNTLTYYKTIALANSYLLDKNYKEALDLYMQADSLIAREFNWEELVMKYIDLTEKDLENMADLKSLNTNLNNSLGSLSNSIQNMKEDVENKEIHIDTLKRKLKEATHEIEGYMTSIGRLRNEIEKIKSSYASLSFTTPQKMKVSYFGEVKDDEANGYGMGVFDSKGIYEGQWKNGLRHGKGKYTWLSNGDIYEGEFYEGKRQGYGKYVFASGERYEGDWKDDLRHGKGAFFSKEGKVLLDGNWEKDKFLRNGNPGQSKTDSGN